MASKSTGEIDYVIKVVATKTRSQKTSEMSSALYVLPLKIDKAGINNMEDAYNILVELKNTMSVHPTNTLRIILSEGLNQDYIRKLCESVFVDITVNIIILSESKIRQKTVKNRTPKPQMEKVVVKSAGNTYADLLKLVKQNVDPREVGVKVKTIRKTMAGDLLLEVEGNRKKAGELKEAIINKVGAEVKIPNNTATIHVLDIDAAITKSQVEDVLGERNHYKESSRGCAGQSAPRRPARLGDQVNEANQGWQSNSDGLGNLLPGDRQDLEIKSMRPTRDGNQIATVQVSRANANMLVKLGRVKIDWVSCRIRERITIIRCYKCLEFGHASRVCQGLDRSNLCLNCNQPGHKAKDCKEAHYCPTCRPGHKAKDCKEAHYCPTCSSGDHRADTTKCPKFRQMMSAQRKLKQVSNTNAR
ncbi:Zinc knuckle [Popillia japonica]|uniref:Zinc knuckle n=1 Tax=Popillia japonica TaxID=7064 RepID=A0AAW1JDL9_POPJA